MFPCRIENVSQAEDFASCALREILVRPAAIPPGLNRRQKKPVIKGLIKPILPVDQTSPLETGDPTEHATDWLPQTSLSADSKVPTGDGSKHDKPANILNFDRFFGLHDVWLHDVAVNTPNLMPELQRCEISLLGRPMSSERTSMPFNPFAAIIASGPAIGIARASDISRTTSRE